MTFRNPDRFATVFRCQDRIVMRRWETECEISHDVIVIDDENRFAAAHILTLRSRKPHISRRPLGTRQENSEGRPCARLARYPDVSSTLLNDSLHHG